MRPLSERHALRVTMLMMLGALPLVVGCQQRHVRVHSMAGSMAAATVRHLQVPLDEVVVTVPSGHGKYCNLHVELTVDIDQHLLGKVIGKLREQGIELEAVETTEHGDLSSLPVLRYLFGFEAADVVKSLVHPRQTRSFQSLIAGKTVEVALQQTSALQLDLARIHERLTEEYKAILPGAVEQRLELEAGTLDCIKVVITSMSLSAVGN